MTLMCMSAPPDIATRSGDPGPAPSILVVDIARLSDDHFAIVAADLVTWIETMNIAKRVTVAPFDWTDAVCAVWQCRGFEVLWVTADNDNVATAAHEIASRYARVYIATATSDLTNWSAALPDTPIMVGWVRSSAGVIPVQVKARAASFDSSETSHGF